jgi:hypothetical protein
MIAMRHRLAAAFVVVTLASAGSRELAAQTSAVPPPPHLVASAVGPEGWRQRLGPTNLGSLLASERGRELWQPQLVPMWSLWQQLVGDETTFPAARDRLLGHSGAIHLGVWFGSGDFGPTVAHLALVIEGDGHTDLAALAADLRQWQQSLPGTWAEATLDGTAVAFHQLDGDAVTAPLVEPHRIVLAAGATEALAGSLQRARSFVPPATGKPPAPQLPVLQLRLDTPQLVAMARDAAGASDFATMVALGFAGLGPTTFTLGSAGPRVTVTAEQAFAGKPQGLFAALMPPTQGVTALRGLATGSTFQASRFDWRALAAAALATLGGMRAGDAAQARAELRQELGIDLLTDLLDHTTDELLFTALPTEAIERPEDLTWVLGIGLRDAAKFDTGLGTLLANSRPFLTREAEVELTGYSARRYGSGIGYDVWFVVTPRAVLVGGGRDAEALLGSTLAQLKTLPATAPAIAEDQLFADLGRWLPAGLHGLSRYDLAPLLLLPPELWLWPLLDELVPGAVGRAEPVGDEPEAALGALLREHQLATVRTASGYGEAVWRWRLYW